MICNPYQYTRSHTEKS